MSVAEKSDEVATRLGDGLRQARAIVDVTQAELARRLGVIPQYVNRWESGARRIDPEMIEGAERALGVRRGTIWRLAGYVDDEGLVDLDLLGLDAARAVRAVIREFETMKNRCPGSS